MKLAIDLGSTEFKAAVISGNGRITGSSAYKLSYLKSGVMKTELSAEEAKAGFLSVISSAVNSAGLQPRDIKAIGISSQAQTFTIADQKGLPQIPFISWLDQRAVEICEIMRHDKVFADFSEHSTLAELSAGMQIAILSDLKDKSPELFTEKMQIIPLPTYLIQLLTGNFVSDCNIAAMSGLYSLQHNDYWENALDYLRISQKNLPIVIDLGYRAGLTALNFAELPDSIPVYSCGNDQTAGAYGADLNQGDILVTLGTAQIAYCCCEKMPESAPGLFRGIYPNKLFYAMYAENGGAIISHLLETMPEFKDFDTFANFAECGSQNADLTFSVDSTGSQFEWSENNANIADKALAVFVYLAKRIESMVKDLQKVCGENGTIYITGGGTKNRIWVELIDKALNKDLKIIETSPALGVAKMMKI